MRNLISVYSHGAKLSSEHAPHNTCEDHILASLNDKKIPLKQGNYMKTIFLSIEATPKTKKILGAILGIIIWLCMIQPNTN